MSAWTDRIWRWIARVETWGARVGSWVQRTDDRWECFLERRVPWASRRNHAAYLLKSADEIEHILPKAAARHRRMADKIEREGLEIAFRMDQEEVDP